jgi:drug/metabolite transporter (DMT)-like permease
MTPDLGKQSRRGALLGLAAAASFGVSAPLAKLLLAGVPPLLLAGVLYLGAAFALWLHRAVRGASGEAQVTAVDVPKLAGVVFAGGILGPILMLLGLQRVTALAGSLLLNLEAPFTILLAVVFFGEHLGRPARIAVGCILAGALVLRVDPGQLRADGIGILLLASACACWAVDNNLTQRLTLRDPFAIVRVKTLAAGVVNTALALAVAREEVPSTGFVLGALALGSVSYGASVVLDAYALRLVGAAREAAYFATAPFVGAATSVVLLNERLGAFDALAMFLMAAGVVLLVRERHGHVHRHERLEHVHLHEHDAHHQHEHLPGDPPGDPHAHPHRHATLVHDHPHVPDIHHRHRH